MVVHAYRLTVSRKFDRKGLDDVVLLQILQDFFIDDEEDRFEFRSKEHVGFKNRACKII